MDASKYFKCLLAIRESSEADDARQGYIAQCKSMPTFGHRIAVWERDDNTGFFLETTGPICEGTPITAFPPDAVVVEDPPRPPLQGLGKEVVVADKTYNMYGPLALSESPDTLAHLFGECAFPTVGYQPFGKAIFNPSPREAPTPDLAGFCVADVFEGNPYDGLLRTDEAVPTLAQATVAYLQKAQALANVTMMVSPNVPTALVAIRNIGLGEVLRTGRPPLFHLDNDAALAEKIATLLWGKFHNAQGDSFFAGITRQGLRQMIGLPEES